LHPASVAQAEAPTRQELELFLREVATLAALHHRNIVQFYGACLDAGGMFFATELMKGGDLYSALRHHAETMRWERLGRKVALDVALGLNYLHSQVSKGRRILL
jgi:serine/threonine protein kinase